MVVSPFRFRFRSSVSRSVDPTKESPITSTILPTYVSESNPSFSYDHKSSYRTSRVVLTPYEKEATSNDCACIVESVVGTATVLNTRVKDSRLSSPCTRSMTTVSISRPYVTVVIFGLELSCWRHSANKRPNTVEDKAWSRNPPKPLPLPPSSAHSVHWAPSLSKLSAQIREVCSMANLLSSSIQLHTTNPTSANRTLSSCSNELSNFFMTNSISSLGCIITWSFFSCLSSPSSSILCASTNSSALSM
mmetsp:Transcript_53107/g.60405  ORF Transcript_53107/g.60405 Transcript_53107/m.60405 type:complete len:248 (-) Transcript_53107:953-1696(-)